MSITSHHSFPKADSTSLIRPILTIPPKAIVHTYIRVCGYTNLMSPFLCSVRFRSILPCHFSVYSRSRLTNRSHEPRRSTVNPRLVRLHTGSAPSLFCEGSPVSHRPLPLGWRVRVEGSAVTISLVPSTHHCRWLTRLPPCIPTALYPHPQQFVWLYCLKIGSRPDWKAASYIT